MSIFDRPTSKELLEAVLHFVNEEIESNDYTKDNGFRISYSYERSQYCKKEVNLGRKIEGNFF